jgi:VWFA-related protein
MRKAQSFGIALRVVVPALVSFFFLSAANAQEQTPKTEPDEVIRIKTDLVQLQTVITDRLGRAVDNLKQDEFEILENGKPQKVSFFSVEHIGAGPAASAARTQVASAEPEAEVPVRKKVSRTIVIFVDTLHLSAVSLMRAKQQLKKLVDEQITDEDMVAVVTSSWSLGILQQFIKDRKLLKYAIDRISAFPKRPTLFTPYLAARVTMQDEDALGVATQILAAEEGMPSPPSFVEQRARYVLQEEAMLRKSTLQVLAGVSDRLAEMPGQRLIAFLSDGFTMLEDGSSSANQDLVAATSRAARRGVVLYSFEPAGLQVPVEYQASVRISGADFGRYMADSLTDSQGTLRELAAATGGEAYLNNNDLNGLFKKMMAANQVYYSIAYYPASDSDKPRFRNITVRLRNHPEYKIRTQRGYQPLSAAKTSAAATPRQRLVAAMMSPLPLTGIDVDSASSFLERDDGYQVTLQVHIAGNTIEYQAHGEKYSLNCEIAVAVISQAGKISESVGQGLKGELTARQVEVAKLNGYRYEKRLKLEPGIYQVRVGVREVKGELMGTSTSWVVVPDLRKQKLALSNIFLARKPSPEENIKLQEAGAGSNLRPTVVIGRRAFKKNEPLFYRFVAYNSDANNDSSATQVRVEVLRGETPVYEGPWQPLASRSISSDKTGIEAGGELTLGVEPGVYSLRVTIKEGKSKATAQQTIDFELE